MSDTHGENPASQPGQEQTPDFTPEELVDLAESLEQMRRGETEVLVPKPGRKQAWDPDAYNDDGPTVCPEHLRFVPCRRCEPGQEKFSTDSADVDRTRRFQSGGSATNGSES